VVGGAEVVSTKRGGVGVLDAVEKKFPERSTMKRYLKFAASFWVGAFLAAGSMAVAQTTPAAKPKKKSAATASAAPAASSNSTGTTASSNSSSSSATQPVAAAHDQPGNTTTAPAPKMVVGPDKHMVPAPQP